jgi:predicted nucleic-acid-binding protein
VIGLDTNVLIRYIVRDDSRQAGAATRLIEAECTPENPGLINPIVLCELVWVLTRGYGYDRLTTARVIRRLLSVQELRVTGAETAWRALRLYEKGQADLADYLIGISNQEAKASVTYTFDQRAAEADLFRMCPPGV